MAQALARMAAGFGAAGRSATGFGPAAVGPAWQVVRHLDGAEVRSCAPGVAAQVMVRGERADALAWGHALLARYMAGANDQGQEVATTGPVMQRAAVAGSWAIWLALPGSLTRDRLPQPADHAVRLIHTAAESRIVMPVSGRETPAALAGWADRLQALARAAGLDLVPGPILSVDRRPLTLPWNRRNELSFVLV